VFYLVCERPLTKATDDTITNSGNGWSYALQHLPRWLLFSLAGGVRTSGSVSDPMRSFPLVSCQSSQRSLDPVGAGGSFPGSCNSSISPIHHPALRQKQLLLPQCQHQILEAQSNEARPSTPFRHRDLQCDSGHEPFCSASRRPGAVSRPDQRGSRSLARRSASRPGTGSRRDRCGFRTLVRRGAPGRGIDSRPDQPGPCSLARRCTSRPGAATGLNKSRSTTAVCILESHWFLSLSSLRASRLTLLPAACPMSRNHLRNTHRQLLRARHM
jgi:hypothetical protein